MDTPAIAAHTPRASILLLNWNGAALLPRCLAALQAQTCQDFEIVLVDNGSTDGSVDGLEAYRLPIHLIRLNENRGFAAANNLAARQARGDWLVLLNNDAFPEPGWLAALLEAAERFRGAAAFGSRMIRAGQPHLLDGTGDLYHISGLAWRRHYNQPLSAAGDQPDEIFSANAAAAMIRRDLYLQLGGLDEDFFAYHEDVDLGFRIRLRGFDCMYVPGAVVHHIGSATTSVRSDFAVYYGHRNLVWSYFQNMPGFLLWKYLPAHLLAGLVFLGLYTLRGQGRAIWRAKWDALRGLPRALRKRRALQSGRKATPKEIERVLSRQWLAPWLAYRARRPRA